MSFVSDRKPEDCNTNVRRGISRKECGWMNEIHVLIFTHINKKTREKPTPA